MWDCWRATQISLLSFDLQIDVFSTGIDMQSRYSMGKWCKGNERKTKFLHFYFRFFCNFFLSKNLGLLNDLKRVSGFLWNLLQSCFKCFDNFIHFLPELYQRQIDNRITALHYLRPSLRWSLCQTWFSAKYIYLSSNPLWSI